MLKVCLLIEKTKCQLSISNLGGTRQLTPFNLKSYMILFGKNFSAIGLSFYSFIFLWYEFITLRCHAFFIHRDKLFLFLFFLICVMRFSGLSQIFSYESLGLEEGLELSSEPPAKKRKTAKYTTEMAILNKFLVPKNHCFY